MVVRATKCYKLMQGRLEERAVCPTYNRAGKVPKVGTYCNCWLPPLDYRPQHTNSTAVPSLNFFF